MDEFQTEVLTRLARIETKLDDYDSLKTKAEETKAKSDSNERRITDLEDKQKWLSRTIIGALITGRNIYNRNISKNRIKHLKKEE